MKLTENDLKVLILLKQYKRLRYSDLQNMIKISPAGLTKLLNKLASSNLIKREVEPDRTTYYSLTPEGLKISTEVAQERVKESYMALMSFDPERARKLLEELKKLAEQKE